MSTTVMFQEGGTGSYTPTTFDDCEIDQGSDASINSWEAIVRNASGTHKYSPLAVKDLFTLLPATDVNGSTLSISSAQLILTTYNATTTNTLYVDRMTSNWLANAAGANETNVSYQHKLLLPTPTVWAGGGDISASDYTTTNEASVLWATSNNTNTVDITAMLKDIYSTGVNDGFLIRSSSTTGSGDAYYTSEYSVQTTHPVLKITYDYIPKVTITATDASAAEPSNTGTYTVTRTGTGSALAVSYTVTGTATNGTDYTSLTGTVTIPSGQASATITLTPINDNTVESTETAILTLAAGTGYTVGSPNAATVNIADNDSTVSITATQPNAAEPSTNGTFTVTRAGYTGAAVTVNYTATGTATNGTDYTSLTGSVTIASGQTTATITVAVTDDATVEGTETAILTLTSGTDYTVGSPNNATVNIADNDSGSFGITGVSGTINANQQITITGVSFGSGPDNVVFDNYDGGAVGTPISTGTGSATVGNWDKQEGNSIYSTDASISGKQALKADWTTSSFHNDSVRYFPAGTDHIYFSSCVQIPTVLPGFGIQSGINWKYIWVMGTNPTNNYASDDTDIIFLGDTGGGPDNQIKLSGNCALDQDYLGWHEFTDYNAGDWIRESISMVGGTTTGSRTITLLNLTTGQSLTRTDTNVKTWSGGSPDEWRGIGFNDYGCPSTPNSFTLCDDAYSSTGVNDYARVEIGNASTYAACTKLSTCPTTSWSGTSITALTNLGSLNPAGPLYLYVTKADGSLWGTTSAGYAITASQAPLANNDTYSVTTNNVLTVSSPGVIANDVDLQGGTITASKVSGPSHGTVTFNSNGSFTYTPNSNYYGTDSFTYQDSDGTHTSNTGTVSISVRQLMVKFSNAGNTYGSLWTPQWNTVFKGQWMGYASDGNGIGGSDLAVHTYAGLSSGTAQTFNAGQTVYATWHNDTTGNITFTPQVSFDDPDGDGDGTSGTWYNLAPVGKPVGAPVIIGPGQSVTSSYTLTTGNSYSRINVCMNLTYQTGLLLSSIEVG